MPVVLDIPGVDSAKPFEAVFARLKQVDEKFSPYKKSSELSRMNRGEDKPSAEMKQVIDACRQAEKMTGGYFSAWYENSFEPSGYVKGWAINEAAELLKSLNAGSFCLSAGGDILASGGKSWRIGIQDPSVPANVVAAVRLKNGGIATSGDYERGKHIINPKTHKPAEYWSSFTVIGEDIVLADVLATAGFAAGLNGLKIVESNLGYEALAVNKSGKAKMTIGFGEYLA